ncbi:hypothetical protein [Spirosoma utsteinense]|uniref:Outer membrane protein beta-barrel domain-containing protein n=1 Tax=Spirosoma utsteinense TaxID=2585773 RepID=A0ABR6WFE4_9BACT|nr:hypothetical protein [Spirosoma utsteinense]MBC3789274.1 hypothetical protein [Spirosoma utsteinense]MBC3795273.1 hypothetical protein [Spirosoma utsteinense]
MKALPLISVLVFLGSPFVSQGQSIDDSKFWLSAGLGKTKFIHGMIAAGYKPKDKSSIIISRYSVTGELVSFVEPGLKTSEFGLLYGLKRGKFTFASGLSTVWGRYRGKYMYTDIDPLFGTGQHYETVNYKTVGVPAEIRYITSTKYAGIGITAFGNLNNKNSFAGLNVSLYVGRLK